MKRGFIFFIAVMSMLSLFAQQDGQRAGSQRRQRDISPEQMAAQQTDRLNEVLNLDSVQYQIVYIMNYSDIVAMQDSMKVRRERMQKAGDNGRAERVRPTDEEMKVRREIAEQRRAARNAQMKEILTPEQYDKYLKYLEESDKRRRENMRRNGGRRMGGARN